MGLANKGQGNAGPTAPATGKPPSEIILDMISRLPEFQYLTRDEVTLLIHDGPHVHQRGEALLNIEKRSVDSLVVLLAGECVVEVIAEVGGKRVWTQIEKICAPGVFGEVGLFSSSPRTARVITAMRCVALRIPEQTLVDHFSRSKASLPRMLWSFARLGATRIQMAMKKFETRMRHNLGPMELSFPNRQADLVRLMERMDAMPPEYESWRSIFSDISAQLESVNRDLALLSYYELLPDPPLASLPAAAGESVTTLPLARYKLDGSLSTKQAIARALLDSAQVENAAPVIVRIMAETASVLLGHNDTLSLSIASDPTEKS
ncbi:MAG: cyclic nucleotide-binding domain-containing protein [Nitrospinae bacterium]|nr:cyclic nucleotide-binding domain-containing protein [Nitrospinota bacterium]